MRYIYLPFIVIFLSLLPCGISQGVIRTSGIEVVVDKDVLDSSDFAVIDDFVSNGVNELLKTTDFSSVASIRSTILRYNSSNKESAKEQYSNAFFESIYRHMGRVFSEIESIDSAQRRHQIIINLLILVDNLGNRRLAEYAVQFLNSENTVVRYWALHSVSNRTIIEQMNTGADGLLLANKVAKLILEQVETAKAEEQDLMLQFASGINLQDGDKIILSIADVRISRYAKWEVNYELLDARLLWLLHNELSNADTEKQKAFGKRFCILFSYVFQRYIKGAEVLDETHKRHLASVLVDVERNCVSSILGQAQITVKQTIEGDSMFGLLEEHNRLLGDETRAGELPKLFNCDYGNNADGSSRMYPPELPAVLQQ
jgi:hypothetical protein